MAKRIIGLVLALCLIVGLLPMIALADSSTPKTAILKMNGRNNKSTSTTAWEPTLTEGMDPIYRVINANGAIASKGASADNWCIRAEWPTGGNPTLTLKDATITNDVQASGNPTIRLDGTADFEIVLMGTNTLVTNPGLGTTTSGKSMAISAINTGNVTIRGDKATNGSLTITGRAAHLINKAFGSLTIKDANITLNLENTDTKGQTGILMSTIKGTTGVDADFAPYVATNNLTVEDSNLTINCGSYAKNSAIMLGAKPDSPNAYAKHEGTILFKNSVINLSRNDSTYTPATDETLIPVLANTNKSTFNVDRSDLNITSTVQTLQKLPTVTNCASSQYKVGTGAYADLGEEIPDGTTELKFTHACACATDDFMCTSLNLCDVCGQPMRPQQSSHNLLVDTDCTTAEACQNTGCKYVKTPAEASHKSPADRTSCDVAATCANDGCTQPIPAGQHTGGTATCIAKAKCDVCQTPYGELADHVFTDDNDTTCNTTGCTHTRTVTGTGTGTGT
ncbi:MAG: hypothetical protein IKB80_06875, partial [Oscillospiraceae bacterium]|nr:hypothetical protein [Oscillospiraceae bacterium]